MRRKSFLIILGILIVGFLLRVYNITRVSMYGDELTMVYDTYSILKTGKDSTGQPFPITFRMGAGRQGGYIYGSLPFVYLFGPSELGVRSLSLLSGLGMIVLMYFLGKRVFDNEKIGLIASFLTSISMWDIYLSRGGFEAYFALFLATLGVVCFLYKKYIPMAIVWGLATLTYPTFKLTLPLLFAVILWWSKDLKNLIKNKILITSIIILTLFSIVVVNESLKSGSENRFVSINIFSDLSLKKQISQQVAEDRKMSLLPNSLKAIFYNKQIEYTKTILENYLHNISFDFLYLKGDGNPRHNPGEWGMLYLVDFPLLLVGTIYLFKENRKNLTLIALWILLVPLATMFIGDPHGLRDNFMIPPLIILSAFGLLKITEVRGNIFRFIFLGSISALWLVQFILLLDNLYFLSPIKYNQFWSYPAKMAVLMSNINKNKYDYIFLSDKIDNIQFAYPAYNKIDPNIVIAGNNFPYDFGKYKFRKYDNIYITNVADTEVADFVNGINGTVLYIGNPLEKINNTNLEFIDGPDEIKTLLVIRK